jgi:hypothetical protein
VICTQTASSCPSYTSSIASSYCGELHPTSWRLVALCTLWRIGSSSREPCVEPCSQPCML